MEINKDTAFLPYMTRDFIKMKFEERKNAQSFFGKVFFTFYIYSGQLFNMIGGSALTHLKSRGIYTAYWVLNDEEEAMHVLKSGV